MKLIITALSNSFKNLTRNKLVNVLSLGIICFTLLIFGIFNFITHSIDNFADQFSHNIETIFYFNDDVKQSEIDKLIHRIKENLLVKEVLFKSKNQAETSFSRQFPELNFILSEFEKSPFPASIEVKFKEKEDIKKISPFIDETARLDIIESKQVNLDWINKLLAVKQFISGIGFFLSSVLIFISVFIIYNVIKLNILYRKDEINILRLVGARDIYIRFPFIIEGAFLGFLGSIIAAGFLFITLKLLPSYSPFISAVLKEIMTTTTPPSFIITRLLLLGTGIGLFSSIFSIRQFLKD